MGINLRLNIGIACWILRLACWFLFSFCARHCSSICYWTPWTNVLSFFHLILISKVSTLRYFSIHVNASLPEVLARELAGNAFVSPRKASSYSASKLATKCPSSEESWEKPP